MFEDIEGHESHLAKWEVQYYVLAIALTLLELSKAFPELGIGRYLMEVGVRKEPRRTDQYGTPSTQTIS